MCFKQEQVVNIIKDRKEQNYEKTATSFVVAAVSYAGK